MKDRAEESRIYRKRRILNGGEPLRVPAVGSIRRRRALATLGWSIDALADAMGRPCPKPRGHLINVDPPTDLWWRQAFERFAMTEGPSNRARSMAKTRGWASPLAWLNIDDPDEEPGVSDAYLREAQIRRGKQKARRRRARLRRLEAAGYSTAHWRANPKRSVPTVTAYRRDLDQRAAAKQQRRAA